MASEAEKTVAAGERFARIPQPPEKFLLGNILDLSASNPVQDMVRLAREYGPIYRYGLSQPCGARGFRL